MKYLLRPMFKLSVGFVLMLSTLQAQAESVDCLVRCGLQQEHAYPNLVVGTLESVIDDKQSAELFLAKRKINHWTELPGDVDSFRQNVQPVSIRLPSGRVFTVMISQQEAKAAPLRTGDLVRYSPHRGAYEKPPADPR